MISIDRSRISSLWTEYRFKKLDIFFEIHDFRDYFIFLFWKKNFKRIGYKRKRSNYIFRYGFFLLYRRLDSGIKNDMLEKIKRYSSL